MIKAKQKCIGKKYESLVFLSGVNKMSSQATGISEKYSYKTMGSVSEITGYCIKHVNKKRKKKKVKKERCFKLKQCFTITDSYPNTTGKLKLRVDLDEFRKQWRCK